MPCNFAECCSQQCSKFFPKQDKGQHSKQRKHPLYSDKHNAAIVVFNVSTKKQEYSMWGVGWGEEFMFA